MSTYREDLNTNWWECISINEFLEKAGYKTYWLSNQAKSGMYDVLATQYAKLCHYNRFTQDTPGNTGFDDMLIGMSDSVIADPAPKKAIIYHLIGSHPDFRHRYPENAAVFSKNDYPEFAEHQRTACSHYDNAIHYNDSVVASIMSLYGHGNAAIVYFPTTDLISTNQIRATAVTPKTLLHPLLQAKKSP